MTHPAPAAIDALLKLLRSEQTLVYQVNGVDTRVRVDDGMPVADLDDPDAIGIGLSLDEVAATSDTRFDLRGGEDRFDISCVVQSWTGDVEAPAPRSRAFELLDIVRDVLAAHQNLGLPGLVIDARLSRWSYRPTQDATGVAALIDFTVRVHARR